MKSKKISFGRLACFCQLQKRLAFLIEFRKILVNELMKRYVSIMWYCVFVSSYWYRGEVNNWSICILFFYVHDWSYIISSFELLKFPLQNIDHKL